MSKIRCDLHGFYGQGKSGENQKKSGNFTFQSQGKMRWSGKVRENQSTMVQKLTKMQKKNCELFYADYLYNSLKNFSARFACRLFISPLLNLSCRCCL